MVNSFAVCSSLLKKRTLETSRHKDEDAVKQKKKKKAKYLNDGRGKDSKKLKKHKKHFVAQR